MQHHLLASSFIYIKGFDCFMSWHLKKLKNKKHYLEQKLTKSKVTQALCKVTLQEYEGSSPYQSD